MTEAVSCPSLALTDDIGELLFTNSKLVVADIFQKTFRGKHQHPNPANAAEEHDLENFD